MQLTLNNQTYNATFNFNALDKLMEANGVEYFSELGSLLGEDESEVSRSTITRYAQLVQYGIQEYNRLTEDQGEPDIQDIKPHLIQNPSVLEDVSNELTKALPQQQDEDSDQGDEDGEKKKNPAKKS
jgi:hypothetical protein